MGDCLSNLRGRARAGFVTWLVLTVAVGAARADNFELPALNTPPSTEHHVGKVVWLDLVTPDLKAAEAFYGGLFGWTFQTIRAGDSDYAVASVAGRPIGGMVEKSAASGQHRQSAWLTFIAVRDVDAVKRNTLAHKGKILVDSRAYPMRGRQAVLSDPEGAVFAILASSSGDPPDYLAAPGEWIWSSLHAKKPGNEAAFYQDLFGYEVFDADDDDSTDIDTSEHVVMASDDSARASVNELPHAGHRHAHWLNFVRVEDVNQTLIKATAAGARVLVQAHADRDGSMVALLADPAGAAFGVMEWSDDAGKAVSK